MRVHDGDQAKFCARIHDGVFRPLYQTWGGRVQWPTRSSDRIPYFFFLWGNFKHLVYRGTVSSQSDKIACLHDACTSSVDTSLLRSVGASIPRCAQACLDMHGGNP
ncbi:hypothetical protein TNCV_127241 [Trichonephila clavipes]|nr:hypothetical protein TNCV_127241 [Trichonephila clavipes]